MRVTEKKLLKNLAKGKYDGVCAEYSDGKLSWGFSIEKGKPKSWTREECPVFKCIGLGRTRVVKYKKDAEKIAFLRAFGNDEAFRDFPELAIFTLGANGYDKALNSLNSVQEKAKSGLGYASTKLQQGKEFAKDRLSKAKEFGWGDIKNAAVAYITGEEDNDEFFWEKPASLTKKDIIIVSGVSVLIAGACVAGYIFKDKIFPEADTSWVEEREENL